MIETTEQAAAFLSRLVYADSPGHLDMNFLITKKDALEIIALLKEQEPIAPSLLVSNGPDDVCSQWYLCGKCKKPICPKDRFCKRCGQAVKWE